MSAVGSIDLVGMLITSFIMGLIELLDMSLEVSHHERLCPDS